MVRCGYGWWGAKAYRPGMWGWRRYFGIVAIAVVAFIVAVDVGNPDEGKVEGGI